MVNQISKGGDMNFNMIQKTLLVSAFCIALAGILCAADSELGTWIRTDAGSAKGMIMKIETSGLKGRKLTYSLPAQGQTIQMICDSPMDGSDTRVLMNGKPSGETMAIKRIDDHHMSSVMKVNGQIFGTSKGTFSADFTSLTVEDDFTSTGGGNAVGKVTETWVRK
jgi:hypothetical protein